MCGPLPWLPRLQECSDLTRGYICCLQKIERVTGTQGAPSSGDVDGLTERMEGIESDHVEVLDTVEELSQRMDALAATASSTEDQDRDDDEDAEDEEDDGEGDALVAELEVQLASDGTVPPPLSQLLTCVMELER